MESASEKQNTPACARVFAIYELLHLVIGYVDSATDLLQVQKVCRLLNAHVRDVKRHMSRGHAKVAQVPDSALRFNIFRNKALELMPKRFGCRGLMDDYYRSVHFFQSTRIPKDPNIEPCNMFISQPPVTKATLLIFHRDKYLISRHGSNPRWRHIAVEVEHQQGVTYGCVMKRVGREILGSAGPYMIVLGELNENLGWARDSFEAVVRGYGKMTYGGM